MRNSRGILCLLWTVLCSAGPAQALHLWNTDLSTMTSGSTSIVHGEVVSTRTFFDSRRGEVLTEIEMSARETLKGSAGDGQTVKFIIPGGVYNGVPWAGPGLPVFRPGEVAMVFLDDLRGQRWPYGLTLGIFEQSLSSSGQAVFRRDVRDAHIMNLDAAPRPASETPALGAPEALTRPPLSKLSYYDVEGLKQEVRRYLGVAAPKSEPGVEDQYNQSDAVLVGEVRSVTVFEDPARYVATRVEIAPFEVLKGASRDAWVIDMAGGRLPDISYESYRTPAFAAKEQMLLFLKSTPAGLAPLGVDAKIPGRRKSDGTFELLMKDGRIVPLNSLEFLRR